MDYPSGCQSEERYTYAQSIHLCLFTVLFGENMLHVLLALLVLHFELMQFILIYDNCLKDLLSIFPIYKELFTKRGKSRRESRSLCIVRCKNWVDSVLESALCSRADCQDVFRSTIFCMFGDRNEIKEKLSSSKRKPYTIELIISSSSLVLSSCIYIAAISIVPTHLDDKSAILGGKKGRKGGREEEGRKGGWEERKKSRQGKKQKTSPDSSLS